MNTLAPVTALTLGATVLLLVINLRLHATFGDRFLFIWSAAWACYAARFTCDLLRYVISWEFWPVAVQVLTVASGVLLLVGGFEFLPDRDKTVRRWIGLATVLGTLVALWPIVAAAAGLGFVALSAPPFAFVGVTNLVVAWRFYTSRSLDPAGRWIVVVSFALWGLHKFDYPLLRPIPGAAVWGYALGSLLAISAGIGLLIIYLAAERAHTISTESRFRSLVTSLNDIVFTLDRDGRHTGLFGTWVSDDKIDARNYLGLSAIDQFGPEVGSIHVESARRVFERNAGVTYEWQLPSDDGTRFFQTTLSPIRDAHGTCIEVVGVAREVTPLRRAVEEREVLLREIHHRVKNNLQVMGSLLSLQSREIASAEARAAFAASIERIYALGDVHDLLYSSPGLARIDVAKLATIIIHRVFGHYRNVVMPRMDFSLDGATMSMDYAVPVSLIITELTSAAAQDAGRDPRQPAYAVLLALEGGRFVVELARRGCREAAPPIDPLREKLIAALLSQIGARMERKTVSQIGSTLIEVPWADGD